ncbi:hypothetical protein DL96DRAFT_1614599 [Flagelloscypha sp. PMI_526]|nr:hypothetical protein DL96DRAFT_1614599 [Flagelloscypha sp. PMI_526]
MVKLPAGHSTMFMWGSKGGGVWFKMALVEDFRVNYLLGENHRSSFFNEAWFMGALDGLHDGQLSLRSSLSFEVDETSRTFRGFQGQLERLGIIEQVIRDFLALPILPIPDLPLDISREVFLWAARCHDNPWQLALVSSEVQEWVDSILFHTLEQRHYSEVDSLCSEVISPRLARAGHFVHVFLDHEFTCRFDLSTFASRCPNLTTMIVRWPAIQGLELPLISSLKRLHCTPDTFGTIRDHDGEPLPNFSAPCFRYITTLSIAFHRSYTATTLGWDWALDSIPHLQFLWIEMGFCEGGWRDLSVRTPYIRYHILPRLPPTLECFFLHLEDEFENAERVEHSILQPLADGSLDHRLVLVVSANDAHGHPDALEYSQVDHRIFSRWPCKAMFWDKDWCERGRRIVEKRKKLIGKEM